MKEALTEAAKFYYAGYKILDDSYNFFNWLAIKTFLGSLSEKWEEPYRLRREDRVEVLSLSEVKRIIKKLEDKNSKNSGQSFWNLSVASDIAFCKFLLEPVKKDNIEKLVKAFRKTWTKSGSVNKKARQKENIDMMIYFADFTGNKEIAVNLREVKKGLSNIWD